MEMVRYRAFGIAFVTVLIVQLSSAGANRWTQQGPDGGRVSSIAIDPVVNDTAHAVAASGGGLSKRVDGGAAWSHPYAGTFGGRLYTFDSSFATTLPPPEGPGRDVLHFASVLASRIRVR